MIRKLLLDTGLSVPDAAAIAASMLKTHFGNDESTPEVDEEDSEISHIHHVSIFDDIVLDHEKEVFTSYFMAALSTVISQEYNLRGQIVPHHRRCR